MGELVKLSVMTVKFFKSHKLNPNYWTVKYLRKKTKHRDYFGHLIDFYAIHLLIAELCETACKTHRLVSLCMPPQSAKTTTLTAIAYRRNISDDNFFICGVPLVELKNQNIHDMSRVGAYVIDKYVARKFLRYEDKKFFLSKLPASPVKTALQRLYQVIKEEKDAVLFVDEAHFGAKKDSILYEVLKYVLDHHAKLKIILVTATPFDQHFSKEWMDKVYSIHVPHELLVRSSYFGVSDFITNGLVTDIGCDDMRIASNTRLHPKFKKAVQEFKSQKTRKLFLVRVETDHEISNARRHLREIGFIHEEEKSESDYLIGEYHSNADCNTPFDKLEDLVCLKIVFIKDKFRVGIRIPFKKFIWGAWDRSDSLDTLTQGLIGRMCGHHDNRHIRIFADLAFLRVYQLYETTGRLPMIADTKGGKRKISQNVETKITREKNDFTTFSVDLTEACRPFVPKEWTGRSCKGKAGGTKWLMKEVAKKFAYKLDIDANLGKKKISLQASCVSHNEYLTKQHKEDPDGVHGIRWSHLAVNHEHTKGAKIIHHKVHGEIIDYVQIVIDDHYVDSKDTLPFRARLIYLKPIKKEGRVDTVTKESSMYNEKQLGGRVDLKLANP